MTNFSFAENAAATKRSVQLSPRIMNYPESEREYIRTALGASPMRKSACHLGHFFAILKSTLPPVKKSNNLAISQNGITLHCGDNVNAVLGPWVPSHRSGDPLHKLCQFRPYALLPSTREHRYSRAPLLESTATQCHKRAAYQKQRSHKIPPALCRCNRCPPASVAL